MIAGAETMIHLDSYKIIGIDMSFRDTGLSILNTVGNSIDIKSMSITCSEFGSGFNDMVSSMIDIRLSIEQIKSVIDIEKPDAIIVEMPVYTQSAKAALAIGMCWGVVSQLDCFLIEPSALKKWSGSKRGDKKNLVKEKVIERITLSDKELSNDNIIDAIGISLMFNDVIRQKKYEYKANQR